jgi:hypothetical protein
VCFLPLSGTLFAKIFLPGKMHFAQNSNITTDDTDLQIQNGSVELF